MPTGECILGIDPGLETTGYGCIVVEGARATAIAQGTVITDTQQSLQMRIAALHADITVVIQQLTPDAVALEELYAHYAHPTTAILMGHARGVIALAVAQAGIPLHCYLPTRVKKAVTGNGHAKKRQIQAMVAAILGLSVIPDPNDIADGLALALTHARLREHPLASVTQTRGRRKLPTALADALSEARS
jgi:crossover junction endodeoxyribonuclease RuvC